MPVLGVVHESLVVRRGGYSNDRVIIESSLLESHLYTFTPGLQDDIDYPLAVKLSAGFAADDHQVQLRRLGIREYLAYYGRPL